MTLLAEPPSATTNLQVRYGLSVGEARSVQALFGHQAEDHCEAVVRRLRADLKRIRGADIVLCCDIPALTLAKHEAVRELMFTAKDGDNRKHPSLTPKPVERTTL